MLLNKVSPNVTHVRRVAAAFDKLFTTVGWKEQGLFKNPFIKNGGAA